MENLQPFEVVQLRDELMNGNDLSLEGIFSNLDIPIDNLSNITDFKTGVSKFSMSKLLNDEGYEYKKHIPSFIAVDSDKEQTIIIDDFLMFNIMFGDYEVINKFLKQLTDISEDNVVNIIISISLCQVNFQAIDAATFIRNSISNIKAKKIMSFGSETSLIELLIGTCCDDIYISDFASIIINHSVNFNKISEFLSPVFQQFIEFTCDFWMKRGLFTEDECKQIVDKNNSFTVSIFSDDIKNRMLQK
jgi:hypothetical protein